MGSNYPVARCKSRRSEDFGSVGPFVPCDGVRLSNGDIRNGCADPCSFIMGKAGSGEPIAPPVSDPRIDQANALARILYDEAARWRSPLDLDGSGDLTIAFMLACKAIDFLSNSDAAKTADDPHPAVPGQMATSEQETENGF